jgi:hypothetical protein
MCKYKKMTKEQLRSELATLRARLFHLEMGDSNPYKELQIAKKIREIELILDTQTRK